MSPKVRDTVQSRFEEKPRKDMYCLVVLRHPSEKYEFVSWDDDIPNIWENNKCSKPPTRDLTTTIHGFYAITTGW
jgi:hypothetical protein